MRRTAKGLSRINSISYKCLNNKRNEKYKEIFFKRMRIHCKIHALIDHL